MSAVLLPNGSSSSGTPSPSQSSSSNTPPQPPAPVAAVATSAPPQHKTFRQMARAPLETLRTVTRSKGKNKVSASVESALTANEADFKSSLGLSSTTAKLHKNRDKTITTREKGKEKEQPAHPRASIDTTASQVVSEERGALRRLTSRTGLSFGRKSSDAATTPMEASTSGTSSRTRTTKGGGGGGWPSFMTPSQSAGSMSTPTLHLNSDPNNSNEHPTTTTSAGVPISPPRRRPTVSSRDSAGASGSGTPTKKPPPSSPSAGSAVRQNPPSPTTLLLASSSKNTGTSNKRLPPSPSTPSLPSYSNNNDPPTSAAASPPRPIIRRSTEVQREPLPPPSSARGIIGRGERSASRSGGSASGSDSRSASPVTPPNSTGLGRAGGRRPSITYANSPSPPPRRSSDRRPSFEQRTRNFGSISASHLPLGAAPSSIPGQHSPFRTASRERERHVPPPILTGQQHQQPSSPPPSSSLYKQRRNSSSTSFTRPSSPPSSSAQRTHSPVYKSHGRNTSTSSLANGLSAISPQREAMRAAASFIVKEMSKPTPAALKANPPYGGLAGAPGGVKNDPWEEVERRLNSLARLERVWGRSGFTGGGSGMGTMGTMGNASSVSVDATATNGVSIGGGMTVSSGGEERERRTFCEALRDGYVLAQLMNKLSPTSPLPITLVDPREDGFSKTSNILKFREVAKEFIIKSSGPDGKELIKEMFGKDDLAEGKIDGVTRVSRVITILATLKDTSQQQRRWISSKERREVSVARTSTEIDADSSMSGSGTITPGLGRSTVSIAQRISSPPSPNVSRSAADFANDLSQSKLDRRHSVDKHRKVAASPSFATPPTPPPSRPPISERRSSGGHYQLGQVTSTSPPPAPPRSLLRNAPSFNSSNRASVASSAQTHATDHTNLFDPHGNHRSSNRFGTIRTMNTIATDATSIVPDGSVNGSWGREDANNAMTALGLAESLETADAAPQPPPRRRSYDLKSVAQQSGLGLALQSHPPVSSSELFQEGRPRRDRRSSEIAATTDLTRVLEDPEKEGSIRPKGLNRRSSDNKSGLNFGKGKWPDDFVGRFNGKAEPTVSPYRPATPDLDEDPFLAVTSSKERSLSPLARVPSARANDTTPKGKAAANGTAPITIVTAASRQVTPSEEKDDPNSLSASTHNLPYRRPNHRAGSQSVDVLLPRTDRRVSGERRISIDRRPSAERTALLLKSEHMRESSSGSGESQTGVESPPIRRPLRRASTQSRQAVYIPKRGSPSEDLSSSSVLLPAVASVPAVSHIRVPFPRTTSGEHQLPAHRETHKPRAAFPSESESTVRDYAPSPLPRDESLSRKQGTMNLRPRYQSDLEATRLTLTRRGSSNAAPNGSHRRGSHGAEEHSIAPRGRFDPSQNLGQAFASSTNLARASSVASAKGGSNMRRTIVVREEGRVPMHYQLGNCIGRGQFGSVYRALNINTGQIVAVKRIRLEGLPESEITQLMKEVDLLKRLHHPSIVQYEGMVRDDDSLDIVLEYVENGSLGQTLKAFGKFNEKLVATYVTKILEGLHYLHEQQVVHCDLKAANILSTKNGNIKLSDFGVSLTLNAMENAKETANNVAGTPNWMAPEVIELKGASTASDIWSLGCTVVELLTGKPPYSEIDNTLAVMFRIVEDDKAPIPDGCSETLRDFLAQCFRKDPDQRPTAESLFEHPWLKRTWGLHKELRPDDSVPFLRRISTDLQARQLSIQNLAEVARTQSTSPASPLTTSPGEPEFVVKPHSFVKTSFSKPVTCKVCQQSVKKSAVLCEECSLICHATCAKDASSHCDVRAQLLLYSQYAQAGLGNGSPRVASSSALPSPGPPPSPRPLDVPLSGSPSVNNTKFFVPPWKRLSKASTPDANSVMGGADERGSQRRSGNFLFRRSEDRSRSRRDSMAGGSQNSASTRSAATRESQRSTSRMPGDLGQSRISTITFEAEPELPAPQSTPLQASMQLVNDPTRRTRRSRKDSRTDSKDCVIQ